MHLGNSPLTDVSFALLEGVFCRSPELSLLLSPFQCSILGTLDALASLDS